MSIASPDGAAVIPDTAEISPAIAVATSLSVSVGSAVYEISVVAPPLGAIRSNENTLPLSTTPLRTVNNIS